MALSQSGSVFSKINRSSFPLQMRRLKADIGDDQLAAQPSTWPEIMPRLGAKECHRAAGCCGGASDLTAIAIDAGGHIDRDYFGAAGVESRDGIGGGAP